MITEDYVNFETAKLLKDKGFDETCRTFWKVWDNRTTICDCSSSHLFEYCHNSMLEQYNDNEELNVAAPTLQMAMKWLREVHKLCISITPQVTDDDGDEGCLWQFAITSHLEPLSISLELYEQYKQACEEAIKYCLENLI